PVAAESGESVLRAWLEQRGCGFADLTEFGLVGAFSGYSRDALAMAPEPPADLAPLGDHVMVLALADAVIKLEEAGVPREIAGQRLAEVITKCQEAVAWQDLPRTAGVAERFLARESGLASLLAAEFGRPGPVAAA
ncbi:MAG TPA: hypothetical protein VGC54_09235, partial [Planctomycetota bacterium]